MSEQGNDASEETVTSEPPARDGAASAGSDNTEESFGIVLSDEDREAKITAAADVTQVADAEAGEDYMESEVIVLCDTEEEAQEIAAAYAASTGYTVTVESFSYGVAVLKMSGSPDRMKIRDEIGICSVDSVENMVRLGAETDNDLPAVYPNYIRHADSVGIDNEDEFEDPMVHWDSEGYEGMTQWYHDKINDKYVWDLVDHDTDELKTSLSGIHVAVLDSGINYEHADFDGIVTSHRNHISDSLGHDGGNSTDYELAGGDTQGHGTNVSGIIGNVANTIGGRGVAAGVMIDSYRVLDRKGSGYDSEIIAGLGAVLEDKRDGTNIRIVNMSLGSVQYSGAYEQVLLDLYEAGVLVIAAAGNDNSSANHYPACYERVMSVAALNEKYEKAEFSNYGNMVDIAAPGGEGKIDLKDPTFRRTNPLWASGMATLTAGMREVEGQYYTGMNGTSQATPVVSGCAALLFAQHPEYTPDEVENILETTARPVSSKVPIGAGCVDIAAAMAIDTTVPAPESDTNAGTICAGQEITLSMPDDYAYSDYVTIAYTLNGKKPFAATTKEAEVSYCKPGDKISPEGAGKITLCMQAYLFGNESAAVTYAYTFADAGVESIKVRFAGNFERTADGEDPGIPYGGYLDVAEGKTVIPAVTVAPAYAKNKKLTWTSANKDIATVDATGRIKGVHTGETKVTAASADGAVTLDIPVKVHPVPEQLQFQGDVICLVYGGTPNKFGPNEMDNGVFFHPGNVSAQYTLKSSNERVVTVKEDSERKWYLEAAGPGKATVTVTAADGSNLSDTVTVFVDSLIKTISISAPNQQGIIAKGVPFKPNLVLNGGAEITLQNQEITWETNPAGYASSLQWNEEDQTLTWNGTDVVPATFKLTAVAGKDGENEVRSNTINLNLYERASAIDYVVDEDKFVNSPYPTNISLNLNSYFKVLPDTAAQQLKFSLVSGPAKLNSDTGYLYLNAVGYVTFRVEALDGTGVTELVTIRVAGPMSSSVQGMKCSSGNAILYPGKSISIDPVYSKGKVGNFKIGFPGEEVNITFYNPNTKEYFVVPFLKCRFENAGLKINGNRVTASDTVSSVDPGKKELIYSWYTVSINPYGCLFDTGYVNDLLRIAVELYPAGTTALTLKTPGEVDPIQSTKRTLQPGESERIDTTAVPDNACQKYFTYKSSNTKVVTVDTIGRVTAVGNGKATVTVTAGDGSGKTAKVDYTVARVANSIVVSTKTGTDKVIPGKTLNMTATVLPADTVDKKVTWSLENGTLENDYAKINATSGLLTAKKPGSVTVVAKNTASGKTGELAVVIVAATGTLELTDAGVSKDGVAVYTHSSGSLSNTAEFHVKVSSATAGMYAQPPTPTSSNTAFFTVEQSGAAQKDKSAHTITYTYKVTARSAKACNGTVNIAATDGSNKKLSVRVKVLVPVSSIEITTPGNADTVTPGKSLKLTAKTNADASDKTVKWEFDNETDAKALGIDVTAFKNNGTIKVDKKAAANGDVIAYAIANDNSDVSQEFPVHVRKQGVTGITINEGADAIKNTTLGIYPKPVNANDTFAVSREFDVNVASVSGASAGDYQADLDVKSSNEQIAKASYDAGTKKLKVYTHDPNEGYQATKTGQVTITLKAKDGSNKSTTLTVKVQEPVREIYLSADKTTRDIAANGRLTMKAAVNSNATNKTIVWSLKDESGNEPLDSSIAQIATSGAITPNKNLAAKTTIQAVATAADGSGTVNEEVITLYPAQGAITCEYSEGTIDAKGITMEVDGSNEIEITGANGAYADYLVTYTVGAIRVYYEEKSADRTVIAVVALKKGSSTVKVAARDGSGKSMSFRVMVK